MPENDLSGPRAPRAGSPIQQPPFQKLLHIPATISDYEHIDVVFDDAVDDAVGLEEHLAEIPEPQGKQFLWVGPAVRVFGQAGKRLFNLL